MNIEKGTFDKLVEMGWTPPEKQNKYELSNQGYIINGNCSIKEHYEKDYFYNDSYLENGAARKTKETAQLAAKRMRRMMRLSALSAELGGEVEFVDGEASWYVFYNHEQKKWEYCYTMTHESEGVVYMTAECARKICSMLNDMEFEL